MSGYVILIQGDERRWQGLSAEERSEIDAAHREFSRRVGDAILASGELQGTETAVTVRRGPDGEPRAVDGPFTEAKEVVGGFYVIDVPTKAEAVALASLLAEARHDHSGVQVQPLVDHGAS
ncbi:YciI family protein [Leifsonia virtsii]|uniref:YciI family protein n=1 Tax=Leifsonia virtsii TaxID=3035915 RepID=A0ABT8ITQ4_9MICO|nr:YciI family protein [Leifsonia virtsii]MDN4596178.1 YciI family protein [Leifsonia virtsii]